MRNNKILATAIASVVSLSGGVALLGAGDVFAAGNLQLVSPGTDPTAFPFATQLFPDGTIANNVTTEAPPVCDGTDHFVVRYKIPYFGDVSDSVTTKVKASLSGSATWGFSINPATQVKFCHSLALSSGGSCGVDFANVTITKSSTVPSGATTDAEANAVEFIIQVTAGDTIFAANATSSAYLFFCPSAAAPFLETAESTLSLTMEISIDSYNSATGKLQNDILGTETIPIATSKAGLSVQIDAATVPTQAAISFSSDSTKFATGSTKSDMVDTDRVNLGTVYIYPLLGIFDRDGDTLYVEDFTGWSGKLTIVDGPFSASDSAPNQIFLNKKDDCIFDSTTSIPANTVSGTTAEWTNLDKADLALLNTDPGLFVCVVADTTQTIEEQTRAPSATLQMGSGSTLTKYNPGRLRHLKENGTKCTLFNIPDGTEEVSPMFSTDVVSIRVTNNGPDEGTLYATLYDQSGKPIYTPKRQAIGTIAPFATVRYYTGQESMDGYDEDFDLTQYGNAQHWVGQRATLVIATELPDVTIFDLVRNRNSAPNMNMSTGATGNGCD